jgi:hypothetical protein
VIGDGDQCFEQLLSAYLDGGLSRPAEDELRALLDDPARAEAFGEMTRLDGRIAGLLAAPVSDDKMLALLWEDLGAAPAAAAIRGPAVADSARSPAAPTLGPVRRTVSLRWVRWGTAAAAGAALAVGLYLYSGRAGDGVESEVVSGRVLVEGARAERIAPGTRVAVPEGAAAVIRLSDGSIAEFEPASEAVLRGRSGGVRQVVELVEGGGRFRVKHGGGQFRVETQLGSVTALGTEFTVGLQPLESPGVGRRPQRVFSALVVEVASGAVQVDFAGTAHRLGAGESRVFTDESRTVAGVVTAVDPVAGAISLTRRDRRGTAVPVVLRRTAGAAVTVDGREAALSDLVAGMSVVAGVADDNRVVYLRAEGPTVAGAIESVDAAGRTLVLDSASQGRAVYTASADAVILVDGSPAGWEQLRAGRPAVLRLSADGQSAVWIAVGRVPSATRGGAAARPPTPATVQGVVRRSDAAHGTITVAVRTGGRQTEERVYQVPPDAAVFVDGAAASPADVPDGATVVITPAAARPGAVAVLRAEGPTETRVLKAVDGQSVVVVVDGRDRTIPLAAGARFMVNGKPAAPADIRPGATVSLKFSADRKTVVSVAVGRGRTR